MTLPVFTAPSHSVLTYTCSPYCWHMECVSLKWCWTLRGFPGPVNAAPPSSSLSHTLSLLCSSSITGISISISSIRGPGRDSELICSSLPSWLLLFYSYHMFWSFSSSSMPLKVSVCGGWCSSTFYSYSDRGESETRCRVSLLFSGQFFQREILFFSRGFSHCDAVVIM